MSTDDVFGTHTAHVMRRITKQAMALGFTVRFDPLAQTVAAT